MGKYKVDTDQGSYMIETDDGPSAPRASMSAGPGIGPVDNPTPASSLFRALPTLGKQAAGLVGSGLAGAGAGFAKEATGTTLLPLMKGAEKVSEFLSPYGESPLTPMRQRLEKTVQKQGMAENIGGAAADIAEFYAAPWSGGKVANLLEKAPALLRGAARVGTEMATSAGLASLQGADPKTAAALSLIAPATAPVRKVLSEKVAPRMINAMIKPFARDFQFGANPGAGVVNEGIMAPTLHGTLQKVLGAEESIANELGAKLATYPHLKGDVTSAIDSGLHEVALNAHYRGDSLEQFANLREGLLKMSDDMFGTTQLNPTQMTAFKRRMANLTHFATSDVDRSKNDALMKIYTNIDQGVDGMVPEAKLLNQRLANMIGAKKAMEARLIAIERGDIIGLKDMGLGVLGEGMGATVRLPLVARMVGAAGPRTSSAQLFRSLYPLVDETAPVGRAAQLALPPGPSGSLGTGRTIIPPPSPPGGLQTQPPSMATQPPFQFQSNRPNLGVQMKPGVRPAPAMAPPGIESGPTPRQLTGIPNRPQLPGATELPGAEGGFVGPTELGTAGGVKQGAKATITPTKPGQPVHVPGVRALPDIPHIRTPDGVIYLERPNLGEPGGIPPRGEQTVTPTDIKGKINALGAQVKP